MNFDEGEYVIFDNTPQTGYNYSQDLNPDYPPPYSYKQNNETACEKSTIIGICNSSGFYIGQYNGKNTRSGLCLFG